MVPTVERSEEHTSELQSRLHLVCRLLLRSEEHTSELQSRLHLVCRLLLEKKKHTSELQSRLHLVCRLLLEKKNTTTLHYCRTGYYPNSYEANKRTRTLTEEIMLELRVCRR